MAPPPEYDKEPKAPDKSATNISTEDSKLLHNLINDQHTNSDHKPTNTAAAVEVENNKHVETLDDGQLRALLDEAITYKCPKDREGKSSLFKELLEEVEQDEQACEAAARTSGGRGARRGPRGRRALPHSNSLQDLVAALAAEPAPRRAHVRHHAPAPAPSTVSARAIHGGSLPCGVDTSSLLSEEPARAGYLATVRCVNPPPLAERRVSASDANTPAEMELLNRRSKPMFPMTYTARATLEIGSGAVCSGRAVTTTTPSNQVRTPPQARLLRALRPRHARPDGGGMDDQREAEGTNADAPKNENRKPRGPNPLNQRLDDADKRSSSKSDQTIKRSTAKITRSAHRTDDSQLCWHARPDGGGMDDQREAEGTNADAPKNANRKPRGPNLLNQRFDDADKRSSSKSDQTIKRSTAKITRSAHRTDDSQLWADNVDNWYRSLANYTYPLQYANSIKSKERNIQAKTTDIPLNPNNIESTNMENNFILPFAITSGHKYSPDLGLQDNLNHSLMTDLPEKDKVNEFKAEESRNLSNVRYNGAHRVVESYEYDKECDNKLREKYRRQVGAKLVAPKLSDLNPRNVRLMTIGQPLPHIHPASQTEEHDKAKRPQRTIKKDAKIICASEIDGASNSNLNDVTSKLKNIEDINSTKTNRLIDSSMSCCNLSDEEENITWFTNPSENDKSQGGEVELTHFNRSHSQISKIDDSFTEYVSKQQNLLESIGNSEESNCMTITREYEKDKICQASSVPHNFEVVGFFNNDVQNNTEQECSKKTCVDKSKIPTNKQDEDTTKPEIKHTMTTDTENIMKPENGHSMKSDEEHTMKPDDEHTMKSDEGHTMKPDNELTMKSDEGHTMKPDDEHTMKPDNEHTMKSDEGHAMKSDDEHTIEPEVEHTTKSDRIILTQLPNNAYIFLTLPKPLVSLSNSNVNSPVQLHEIENNNDIRPLVSETNRPNIVKKKRQKMPPEHPGSSDMKKSALDKNVLKVLLFENLFKNNSAENFSHNSGVSAITKEEVDSAISFSCITTPEVVSSCNTTSSTAQSAVAVDPKPRSVISSSFNGLPLSRPNYGSTGTSASDDYKKSLDENGNSVQGFSSPLSGSSQHKKPRRKKSSKNETVIDCQQIDGYQGDKDVNELLRFIESNADHGRGAKLGRVKHKDDSDDKSKKRSSERRKDKESKLKRASSLEELSRTKLEDLTDVPEAALRGDKKERRDQPAKAERRSWGDDALYSDVPDSAAAELTDFQTVTKKRKPRRRPDDAPPRRARAPSPRRQDSAPPSERSNDSNDDMDSVHSLPAAPQPAPPPPPPPPVASYADIARTRHNIPDLIESCNFYSEGGAAPAAPPDDYPALEARAAAARRRDKGGRARKPGAPPPPGPDVVQDRRPPVILLDEAQRPRDMDGVTFGFELNEQLLGGARRPRCDLLRDAPERGLPVRAGAAALRYVPPQPPPDSAPLLQLVDYVAAAWEDVLRCGGGKVRYFSE